MKIVKYIRTLLIATLSLSFVLFITCQGQSPGGATTADSDQLYPGGNPGPSEYFTGNVWVTGLVDVDSVFTTSAGNVNFEAGARSNWHLHPAGQILIVTAGKGYHQIEGQPKEIIRKGDVVQCPPDVNHWHGASEDSSMSHIYIIPNTEQGIVEWGDPVTDEEFTS